MRVLRQRGDKAWLKSDELESKIGFGLLAFVGVSSQDTIFDAKYLAKKIVTLRIFKDEFDKSNLSLLDVNGDIMIVSNFTLQADTRKGTRPDFINAGKSDFAYDLYLKFVEETKKYVRIVETGKFGHHMDIDCKLNGPFSVICESTGREHE